MVLDLTLENWNRKMEYARRVRLKLLSLRTDSDPRISRSLRTLSEHIDLTAESIDKVINPRKYGWGICPGEVFELACDRASELFFEAKLFDEKYSTPKIVGEVNRAEGELK